MSMSVQTTEAPRSADPVLSRSLAETDPEVHAAVLAELARQESTLEMIASENFALLAVMAGRVRPDHKYRGLPGAATPRCEHVDRRRAARDDRLKALFGADFANVQPHSGAQANAAAMAALLRPGDTILGLDLAHGGHLTHGMRLNFSGQLYRVAAYHVREDDHLVDMAEVERLAHEQRPRVIIAGWSAYPRHLDFAAFRRIADEVGAYLMVDMAHFAGLVAAGLHRALKHAMSSPPPRTDARRAACGAPGGERRVRPLREANSNSSRPAGGPLEHVIAAKAVAFKRRDRASRPSGAECSRCPPARPACADDSRDAGIGVVSGGTEGTWSV